MVVGGSEAPHMRKSALRGGLELEAKASLRRPQKRGGGSCRALMDRRGRQCDESVCDSERMLGRRKGGR